MEPTGVRGWLAVLCVLLLVWQPISLGLAAAATVDALPLRGLPLALVLLVRVLTAAVGIAAGLALVRRRPGAVAMAKAALLLGAGADLFVYLTPYVPSNRMPGDTPFYVAGSLAYAIGWLMYLVRSRRVRQTFGG